MPSWPTMNEDSYGELAHAILVWDLCHRTGTRRQQVDAERKLSIIAEELRRVGYDVKWKQ